MEKQASWAEEQEDGWILGMRPILTQINTLVERFRVKTSRLWIVLIFGEDIEMVTRANIKAKNADVDEDILELENEELHQKRQTKTFGNPLYQKFYICLTMIIL